MEKRTNIQIERQTLEKLQKAKHEKGETYDEVLNRLMEKNQWTKTNKMQMYLGEFVDRCSIHLLKAQRIGDKAMPEFLRYIEEFLLEVPEKNFEEIIKSFRTLYKINSDIWYLEAELRKGKEGKIGLEETGKRAIEIRDLNSKRISEQNRLIDLFGGFRNIKKNHLSENK